MTADPTLAAIDKFIADAKIDTKQAGWRTKVGAPPFDLKYPDGKKYFWVLETNKGRVRARLFPEVAPKHVTSTIYLTRLGFYDGLAFHRVITGFMAQGGCPLGTGTGGPAYKYAGETSPNVVHDRGGLLSMANAGPGTDGSQFFLTFVATPWLDGKHTIFGEVDEDGLRVLKILEAFGSQSGQTTTQLLIKTATIEVE